MPELAAPAGPRPLDLLAAQPDGVLAYDRELRVSFWNPAMERLTGVSAPDALGRAPADVFPAFAELGEPVLAQAALAGRESVSPEWRIVPAHGGALVWVQARYAPLRDDAGEICGCIATLR